MEIKLEAVRLCTSNSLARRGCWLLSRPVWLVVLEADWLSRGKEVMVGNQPMESHSFIVQACSPRAARLKVAKARELFFSQDGVVPFAAREFHRLLHRNTFIHEMAPDLKDALVNRRSEFSLSTLKLDEANFVPGPAPNQSLHFACLAEDWRTGFRFGLAII